MNTRQRETIARLEKEGWTRSGHYEAVDCITDEVGWCYCLRRPGQTGRTVVRIGGDAELSIGQPGGGN